MLCHNCQRQQDCLVHQMAQTNHQLWHLLTRLKHCELHMPRFKTKVAD